MASQAMPLTTKISQSSASSTSYRTLEMQFGNGYSQRTKDGINNKESKWKITYNNLDSTDRATVWSFLDNVRGTDVITWTPIGGTASQFILDGDVNEIPISGNLYTISFSIKQVFDITF